MRISLCFSLLSGAMVLQCVTAGPQSVNVQTSVQPGAPEAARTVSGEDGPFAFIDGLRSSAKLANRPWSKVEPVLAAYREASDAVGRLVGGDAQVAERAEAERTLSTRRRAALLAICWDIFNFEPTTVGDRRLLETGRLIEPDPNRPRKRSAESLTDAERRQLAAVRDKVRAVKPDIERLAHWAVLLDAIATDVFLRRTEPVIEQERMWPVSRAIESTVDLGTAEDDRLAPVSVAWTAEWFESTLEHHRRVSRELPRLARELLVSHFGVTDAAVLDRVSRE